MKAFALALLCVVAAVQARSTGSNTARWSPAEAGAAPSLVHLRLAVFTSGLLNTCAGSIIDQRWLLTSASCISPSRFIWSRFGAVDVIQPELVLESSAFVLHPDYDIASGANDIALVNLNRNVQFSANIAPPVLASEGAKVPSSGSFYAYGQNEAGGPGEQLRGTEIELEAGEDGAIVANVEASEFDLGAPLIVDGVQYGILVDPATGTFLNPAPYRAWIEETAGISLPVADDSDEDSSSDDSSDSEEVDAVRFVN